MTTALFILAVVAASVCPALMWWNARRGRRGCLPDQSSGSGGGDELESLRRRQTELADRIGELEQERLVSSR